MPQKPILKWVKVQQRKSNKLQVVPVFPIRTCVTCGRRDLQAKLQRFSLDSTGQLVEDNIKVHAGRGAYCCDNEVCSAKFVKNKKKITRVFRLYAGRAGRKDSSHKS